MKSHAPEHWPQPDTLKPFEQSSMESLFHVEESPELKALLETADQCKAQIDRLRPLAPEIWGTIQHKLKIHWTYDSNALEGSTLTLGETAFFLQHGLTVEGKPFKDYLDAKNHAEAIDIAHEIIAQSRPISEAIIKEMNALLLHGVKHTLARNQYGQTIEKPAHPGEYKKQPNHVLKLDGTIHHYVEPVQVAPQMAALVKEINEAMGRFHPVMIAALAHYHLVRIHPFDDGNGRGARLLMNLILMRHGFPPAIIRVEKRRFYLEALNLADQGHRAPFVGFIARSLIETEQMMLGDLQAVPANGK